MIIGLDIGDVRVGVATAEESSGIASPLTTLERAQGEAENWVLELIKKENVRLIVAGLPLSEDRTRTAQCDSVERFCRRLSKRADVTISYVDEYSSSTEAVERFRGVPGRTVSQKVSPDSI